ncbi:hypothetical protein [Nonomuraea sp. NPDC049480]|uniref:hypothetical protein n=1 Tax=Nonomuraea sp. NPDC049480 TaxID=3364353 RepID=UPI00378FF7D0
MSQPTTVTLSVEQVQQLADDAMRVFTKANRLLMAAGVDIAPPTHSADPSAQVVDLAAYRQRRSA